MQFITEGEQILAGGYHTHSFDVSPFAAEEINRLLAKPTEYPVRQVEEAAKYLDLALNVLKRAQERSTATEEDFLTFDEYASLSEEILDELTALDEFNFIRDVHERELIELLEITLEDDDLLDLADDASYDMEME